MERNRNSFIEYCLKKDYNITQEELLNKLEMLEKYRGETREETIFSLMNALKQLSNRLIFDKKIVPGIQGYLNVDDISINFNYGFQDFSLKKELPHNGIFDIASITKLFTMLTTLKLVEQKRLKLSDNLKDISNQFHLDITIKDLLTFNKSIVTNGRLDEVTDRSINEQRLHQAKIENNDFKYSDIPYIILGEIIQEKTGSSIDELIQQEITKPLQMTETTYGVSKDKQDRIVGSQQIYHPEAEQIKAFDPKAKNLEPIASAGLFSTTEDMKKLGTYLVNLPNGTMKELLHQATTPIANHNRGMAVYTRNNDCILTRVFTPATSSAGAIVGHSGTYFCFDPERKFHASVFTNAYHDDGSKTENASTELDYFRKAVYNLSIQVEYLNFLTNKETSSSLSKIKVK